MVRSPRITSGGVSNHATGPRTNGRTRGQPRRRLRLHRGRRGLGRLRRRQPAVGRPAPPGAAAGSRRSGQLDLVPRAGRLPVRHRQPALGLDVPDRAGGRPERPGAEIPARQGGRRVVGDQRHDLHARPGRRLRPLAPARPRRLGLGRRGADLQAPGRPLPGRERASRRRRRVAGRGAAGAVGHPRRHHPGGEPDGDPHDAGLQHRRQHRRGAVPR